MGGMLKAIEDGYIQREIQESSVRFQQEVYRGEKVFVGVNKFNDPEEETEEHDFFEVEAGVEDRQKAKLAQVRAERDNDKVESAMNALAGAIKSQENLMPFIIEAVKSYATVGEISGLMRESWGEFKAPIYI
jgi:methylmalonyl-CoA mutase N-terminal domain/subunit